MLDPEHGYFLATTWRMHPALTAPVSRLSYAGQLHSQVSVTQSRSLDGVEPGLHVRSVDHLILTHESERLSIKKKLQKRLSKLQKSTESQ